MAGEPQVDRWLEEGVGCSEGRPWVLVWGVLGVVGQWEGMGWCWEGVKVVAKGVGVGEAVTRVISGSAVFHPGDPGSPINI